MIIKKGSERKTKAKAPKKGKQARKEKKKAMEKVARKVVSADRKLVEFRKSLMEPAERAMIEFFLYPIAKNRGEKEAAKKVMVESYVKGDEVVKQFILFLAQPSFVASDSRPDFFWIFWEE